MRLRRVPPYDLVPRARLWSSTPRRSRACSAGFTYLETLLVLGVLMILLGLSAPFLISFQSASLLDDAGEQIVQDLRRAQALAVAGVDDTSHGVYFDPATERWVLFAGSSYAEGTASNEVHQLPPSVDLDAVVLGTGGTVILFEERMGRTANAGTVVLRSGSRQLTVSVNAAGTVGKQAP